MGRKLLFEGTCNEYSYVNTKIERKVITNWTLLKCVDLLHIHFPFYSIFSLGNFWLQEYEGLCFQIISYRADILHLSHVDSYRWRYFSAGLSPSVILNMWKSKTLVLREGLGRFFQGYLALQQNFVGLFSLTHNLDLHLSSAQDPFWV